MTPPLLPQLASPAFITRGPPVGGPPQSKECDSCGPALRPPTGGRVGRRGAGPQLQQLYSTVSRLNTTPDNDRRMAASAATTRAQLRPSLQAKMAEHTSNARFIRRHSVTRMGSAAQQRTSLHTTAQHTSKTRFIRRHSGTRASFESILATKHEHQNNRK